MLFPRYSPTLLALSLLLFLFLALSSASLPPQPGSHEAAEDLICHETSLTKQACYPRVFHPTSTFQLVHHDQEIPPGLHVRLNLETGEREAKLNIPGPATDEEASHFPVLIADSTDDFIEGENTLHPAHAQSQQSLLEKSRKTPPAYSNSGRIPPPPSDSSETQIFTAALETLFEANPSHPPSSTLLRAFEDLEDLAHSLYWGLRIASNETTSQKLFGLLSPSRSLDPSVRANAALVLGSSLQNNPSAVEAFVSHFPSPDEPMSSLSAALGIEQVPKCQSRLIYLLFNMARDKTQSSRFVGIGGLDYLKGVFDPETAGQDREKDAVRGRIATFISDAFLEDDAPAAADDVIPTVQNEEGDDDWVLLNLSSHSQMTKTLKPWCATFSRSLERWASRESGDESNSGLEKVQHARRLLKQRMRHAGQGC